MPNSSESQHAQARRALIEDIKLDKKSWLQHGIAALAVSLLGLGVAGSIVLTGSAQQNTATGTDSLTQSVTAAGASAATTRTADSTSRDHQRAALGPAQVKSLADQRAEELSKADDQVSESSKDKAAAARDSELADESDAATDEAKKIIWTRAAKAAAAAAAANRAAAGTAPSDTRTQTRTAPSTTADPAPVASSGGKSCLPITGGYSIAARFGQIGSWSRYHTGTDFAAPVGTQLHAPSAGVVTNAGIGPASSWAGNYVAIRYPDGTQTLMAHMSTVSVQVGQTVSACQLVGAVGLTGRTFGPHVHFEVYPVGVTPGDLYRAVNPASWLNARGLSL